jgi:acetolactate synthase-1/3 small subunit
MLIKLRAPAGPARTEVLQLAEIFRGRVVDVADRSITLCVSGDPGKVRAGVARARQALWLDVASA